MEGLQLIGDKGIEVEWNGLIQFHFKAMEVPSYRSGNREDQMACQLEVLASSLCRVRCSFV
jgi:hypothetical protein